MKTIKYIIWRMHMKRRVFMISDGTGITAETLGNSLITQFEHTKFEKLTIPYIDSVEKAKEVVLQINHCFEHDKIKPLVFITLVNQEISAEIRQAKGCIFDLFNTFIGPLEDELQEKSSYRIGKSHGLINKSYYHRIEAVDYALSHDDGLKSPGYEKADIILVGVSRCGKTPTCIYLALQYGMLAANYPFTDQDINAVELPALLRPYKHKLFGLTIEPARLHQIRSERRPNSNYASIEQCRFEVKEIHRLYENLKINYLDSTKYSIEEIASKILAATGLKRKL